MNKARALQLLEEVITFYVDMHEETAKVIPTNDSILEAEEYIKLQLNQGCEYIYPPKSKDTEICPADHAGWEMPNGDIQCLDCGKVV